MEETPAHKLPRMPHTKRPVTQTAPMAAGKVHGSGHATHNSTPRSALFSLVASRLAVSVT